MTTRSPALDGLRAIVVSLVVMHHWTDWACAIGFGNIGVQLFFVLSGFLITRLLLGMRDRYVAGEATMGSLSASFQLSRIARIWPVALSHPGTGVRRRQPVRAAGRYDLACAVCLERAVFPARS